LDPNPGQDTNNKTSAVENRKPMNRDVFEIGNQTDLEYLPMQKEKLEGR